MSRIIDFVPEDVRKKIGAKEEEEEKKRVQFRENNDELNEFTSEVVKENQDTISEINKSRYSKPNAKMQTNNEEEPGPVMITSDLSKWRGEALKEYSEARYDGDDGFCVVIMAIQNMIKYNKKVNNAAVMSVLENKPRYRRLKSFKSNFDKGNMAGISSYVSAMLSKILTTFGPDTTKYEDPNIKDYPLVERKGKPDNISDSEALYYEFDLEFLEYKPAQIKEVCNAKYLLDRRSREIINKKNVKMSTDTCRRVKILESYEDTEFDSKDGLSNVIKIIQGFISSNKEVDIPSIFIEIRKRKKYRKLKAFASCFDRNGNCTNEYRGRSSISTMLSKVIKAFGPDNPFGAETLAERFTQQVGGTAGRQSNYIFQAGFLKYTPEQIKRVCVELNAAKSRSEYRRRTITKQDKNESITKEDKKIIKEAKQLSALTEFRNNILPTFASIKYNKNSGTHAIIRNILARVKQNEEISLETLSEEALSFTQNYRAFSSGDPRTIKKYLSQISSKLMAAFGFDNYIYKEGRVDKPLVKKVQRGEMVFEQEILKYTPAQIWAFALYWDTAKHLRTGEEIKYDGELKPEVVEPEVEEGEILEKVKKSNDINIKKHKVARSAEENLAKRLGETTKEIEDMTESIKDIAGVEDEIPEALELEPVDYIKAPAMSSPDLMNILGVLTEASGSIVFSKNGDISINVNKKESVKNKVADALKKFADTLKE